MSTFFKKILQFFSRKSADFYGNIILQFLQEKLPIFNRKIMYFPAKNVKSSCKNWQIFLEKWQHFPIEPNQRIRTSLQNMNEKYRYLSITGPVVSILIDTLLYRYFPSLMPNPLVKFDEKHASEVGDLHTQPFSSYTHILCKNGTQSNQKCCRLNFYDGFEFGYLEHPPNLCFIQIRGFR